MIAEKILELIDKYEDENQEIKKAIDENEFSLEVLSGMYTTIRKNEEFIGELNMMLDTPM